MKRVLLACAFTLFAASTMQAQVRVAPELGLNINGQSYNDETFNDYQHQWKLGGRVGVNLEVPLGYRWSFVPGLFYSNQSAGRHWENSTRFGSNTIIQSIDNKMLMHYIQVPFNFMVHCKDRGEGGLFFNFGSYASYLAGGKFETKETKTTRDVVGNTTERTIKHSSKLETGNEANDDVLQYDLGLQAGVGYELKNGLYFRAEYARGLVNITPDKAIKPSMYNNTIGICVGVWLGGR